MFFFGLLFLGGFLIIFFWGGPTQKHWVQYLGIWLHTPHMLSLKSTSSNPARGLLPIDPFVKISTSSRSSESGSSQSRAWRKNSRGLTKSDTKDEKLSILLHMVNFVLPTEMLFVKISMVISPSGIPISTTKDMINNLYNVCLI